MNQTNESERTTHVRDALIVRIAGRDALPVRAIPFVTGGTMSPDAVAKELARNVGRPFSRATKMVAHALLGEVPRKMLPKEWDRYVAILAGLEADLRGQFENDDQGLAAWLAESAGKLPSGVFVWRDEFEATFQEALGEDAVTLLEERDGDRELTFSPVLDDEVRQMVLAGFDVGPVPSRPAAPSPRPSPADDAAEVNEALLPTQASSVATHDVTSTVAEDAGLAGPVEAPDPERRLAQLRALGGNAKFRHGDWKFTGIALLVTSEKQAGRQRTDEKTIRADLREAAQAERDTKQAGALFGGMGKR